MTMGKMVWVPHSTTGRHYTNSPNPFSPNVVASTTVSQQYKGDVLKRYPTVCRVSFPQSSRLCVPNLRTNLLLSASIVKEEPCHELNFYFSKGMPMSYLSAAAFPHLSGEHGSLLHKVPLLPRQNGSPKNPKSPQAFRDDSYSVKRHSVVTKRPEWWWRTLACLPYLIALQISDITYYLLPLLQQLDVDNFIFYIPGVVKLPWWFPILYYNLGYFGVVRNKEWPHFFRFHVMMGMLLENAIQVVWYFSNFMPLIHYNGTYGMQYWAAVGFIYILILLACIRSALCGTFANIPLISDSALIHTLFNIGPYYKPF